ncbi:sensor histidine kinase [Actinophytocola gossypii]|uniref:ATP-binding protein n=1 Tax=Actinophytocola gossypii TaxID=2812003 RepID=A0ABT2JFS7_9PSEU|nr:ATP-binding protein [Actinophytocola gossypii]MCT2586730.1 ATP-binding protein [Actinophytocola gossypii]
MEPAGVTEDGLRRVSQRYVVVLRTTVVVVAGGAAVLQAPADRLTTVAAVVAGLCAWSVVYVRHAPRPWLLWVDTLLVAALGLGQEWLVRPDALLDITNWVVALVLITAVAHQWFTGPVGGYLLAAVLVVAQGTAVGAIPIGLTVFGAAGLSRLLRSHLFAAAARADRAVAESTLADRRVAVAAARRADEREHLAMLHDTAAATLLAVGTRMVDGTEPWLAEQVARDLDVLTARPEFPGTGGEADLALVLDDVVRRAPVSVRTRVPRPVAMPASAASAMAAAAREALTNVARHAGVDTADLVVARTGSTVVVEVADHGRGFSPDAVAPHRRGVGESIERRMGRVGGRAVVTSRPGDGTTIRLEWPVD